MRLYYNNATEPAEDWVRVSAIVDFPDITTRKDMYGLCVVSLRDFEGALFATWNPRDLTEMKMTDDAGTPNILFRGYLINKKFSGKDLILEIAGIGIRLYRRSFGSEEVKNYTLEQGFVKTLNANTQIDLQYKDSDGNFQDFTWDNDKHIKSNKDRGLIIKDRTKDHTYKYWDCEDPIAQVGGAVTDGWMDFESTHDYDDNDYYGVRDGSKPSDLIITATMEGDLIPVAQTILDIEVEYSFRVKLYANGAADLVRVKAYLDISKDGGWVQIAETPRHLRELFAGSHSFGWHQALPDSLKEGSQPHIINEGGDQAELIKYFTLDGGEANYESIQLRLRLEGGADGTAYAEIHVDYLRIKIRYDDENVLPIMYPITDSGASWVKCVDVVDWSAMGITVDEDVFQIGENIRQIIHDIMGYAGLGYKIIDPYNLTETETILLCDEDVANTWKDQGEAVHHDAVSDDNDATHIFGDSNDDGKVEILGVDTVQIREGYIYKIKLRIRGEQNADVPTVSIYSGSDWETPQNIPLNGAAAWHEITFTGLTMTQDDLDALEIKLTLPTIDPAETVIIYEIKVHVYEVNSVFDKYMARKFKGKHCIEPLQAVCKLEGAHWIEDYINNRINIIKPADYVDSGVDLTEANYEDDWEFEDQCNQVKYVYVWGKSSINEESQTTTNIFAKAVSTTTTGHKSKQIIDDNIMTVPDAQGTANKQLALLETKRPSIRIPLDGVNIALQLGTYVGLTMARPTVVAADYKIRMIQRSAFGKTGIKTIVYCGLGETHWDEKIFKELKRIDLEVHKALSDRLESTPYDVGIGGIMWGDVGGAQAAVESIIDAEIVDGQSIDNAIDALIAALVDAAGAVAAVAAADDYIKNDANDETTGDLTVANLITAGNVDGVDVSDHAANNDANIKHLTDAQLGALHAIMTVNAPIVLTGQDIELKNEDGAQITEFDTSALANSDTKVPTNTTVKEYVDGAVHAEAHALSSHTTKPHSALTGVTANLHHNKQHAMDNALNHTSFDIETLNSSASKHGFLKKLDNVATNFMNGQGNWAEPAGGDISRAQFDAINAIGIGNKRWVTLNLEGHSATSYAMRNNPHYSNIGAADYAMIFGLNIPYVISDGVDTYNLVITQTRFGILDADNDDYLDYIRWYGNAGAPPEMSDLIVNDATQWKAAGTYTINHADITIGGVYNRIAMYNWVHSSTANQFDFTFIEVEYYYLEA